MYLYLNNEYLFKCNYLGIADCPALGGRSAVYDREIEHSNSK